MKFSISQNGAVISSVYFNDNTIKEVVTFWTNEKYRSPQFALDLSPTTSSQLNQLYPNGMVPHISMSNPATFEVLTDSPIMSNLYMVELQLNFIGPPMTPEQEAAEGTRSWADHFEGADTWAITPANTAFVPPTDEMKHLINLMPIPDKPHIEISYKILVSFQVAGSEHTYYAIIDPLAKITNSAGEG